MKAILLPLKALLLVAFLAVPAEAARRKPSVTPPPPVVNPSVNRPVVSPL
jgi:hypothetical protein